MRAYRISWTVVVVLLAGASAVAVALATAWWMPLVALAALALLGWIHTVVWPPGPGRLAGARRVAWFPVGGLLVIGLPVLAAAWTVPVLVVVCLTAPPLVAAAAARLRLRRRLSSPDLLRELSDPDLEMRWRRSTARLRHPGTTDVARLSVVVERAALLDEMERRRPGRVADLLGRSPETRGESGG